MKNTKIERILSSPLYLVCGMKYSCDPMRAIANYFLLKDHDINELYSGSDLERDQAKNVKVSDVMDFTPKTIKEIITKCSLKSLDGSMELSERKSFRKALKRAQTKLKSLGFTKEHGDFMKITLYPDEYIESMILYVTENTLLSEGEASTLLCLAKKAGIKITPQLMEYC